MENQENILDLYYNKHLKQKDIANVLNITQQTYSLWENGTKIIPLKHLNSLCNYYDVSMDYVLGLSNVRWTVETVLRDGTLKLYSFNGDRIIRTDVGPMSKFWNSIYTVNS